MSLWWFFFADKFRSLQPATSLNKRFRHSYFPVNFAKFLRNEFPTGIDILKIAFLPFQ